MLIFCECFIKMVMLYQDPDGHSVGTTPSFDATVPNFFTNQSNTSSEEREILIRRIEEKDTKINELILQIKSLTVL